MVEYSDADYLNELSSLIRGAYSPERSSGFIDPIAAHQQVMELARSVFLLNPGAIFYLAFLVRNSLHTLLRRETALVEDMLVALEQLSRPAASGSPIGNVGPGQLRNAAAALFALEGAAGGVSDRPELGRFSRIVDEFADTLRPNVTTFGQFRLSANEARAIIRSDFEALRSIHPKLIQLLTNLRLLIPNYERLDLPTHFSTSVLIGMRRELQNLASVVEQSTAGQNDHNSRTYLLRILASKVIAGLLASFNVPDLGAPVLTSDNTGSASHGPQANSPFLAQAAGEGTPAEVISVQGPWLLDSLTSHLIELRIDGGPVQTFDLSAVQGPGLHGKNVAPFENSQLHPVWPGPGGPDDPPPPPKEDYAPKDQVHVVVDSNVYEFVSQEWGWLGTDNRFHGIPRIAGGGFILVAPLQKGSPIPRTLRGTPRVFSQDVIDFFSFSGFNAGTVRNDYYDTVQLDPPRKLGFKHLGAPIFFTLGTPKESISTGFEPGAGFGGWTVDGDNTLEDSSEWAEIGDRRWPYLFVPRVVTELAPISVPFLLTYVSDNIFSAPSGSFAEGHVGFYIRTGANDPDRWERYEIIEFIDSATVRIDDRGSNLARFPEPVMLFGQKGDRSQVTFSPDLLADTDSVAANDGGGRGPFNIPDTCQVAIGPAVKTATIPPNGGFSMTTLVAALSDPVNGAQETNKYAHASYHCIFREQIGFSGHLTIQGRSRYLPEELGIALTFYQVRPELQPETDNFGHRLAAFPGPYPLVVIEDSAHEVLGYDAAQKVDPNSDPYLTTEELESVILETADADTTDVEVLEEEVFGGVLETVSETKNVRDLSADFVALGIDLGFILEIKDGDVAGEYIIQGRVSSTDLSVQMQPKQNSRGFIGRRTNLAYRILRRRLKIASKNAGPGSTVEIVSAPAQLGFPIGVRSGTVPEIIAVNANGEEMDMTGLVTGSSSGGMIVEGQGDSGVRIAGGVPSTLAGLRFSFTGFTENALDTMLRSLETMATSRSLLGQHGFDVDLTELDAALSPVLAPGATLQSNVGTAKRLLADLLSVLTSTPLRASEYSHTTIQVLSPTMEGSVIAYTAPRVPALDALVDTLNQFRFDRALSLLITGDLSAFFGTTHETASYAGAVVAASRQAYNDTPGQPQLLGDVEDSESELSAVEQTFDGDAEGGSP